MGRARAWGFAGGGCGLSPLTVKAAGPIDIGRVLRHDRSVAGRVEVAVRGAVTPGVWMATPSGRGHFSVAMYDTGQLVLLLGRKHARTPLPWRALEEIPGLLRGRG